MKITGKKFTVTEENVMTITSHCARSYNVWEVINEIKKDVYKCELKETNTSMYDGGGFFKEFTLDQINEVI